MLLVNFVPQLVSFFGLLCTMVTCAFNRFNTTQYQGSYTGQSERFERERLTAPISKTAVISINFRFQWVGNPQAMNPGGYSEIKLAEAREQVIKLSRAVFAGI